MQRRRCECGNITSEWPTGMKAVRSPGGYEELCEACGLLAFQGLNVAFEAAGRTLVPSPTSLVSGKLWRTACPGCGAHGAFGTGTVEFRLVNDASTGRTPSLVCCVCRTTIIELPPRTRLETRATDPRTGAREWLAYPITKGS